MNSTQESTSLSQNQIPHEKATSENGNSTTMSDGSTEQIDEEFSHEKDKKFEFINENYQQWPKWSLGSQ